MKKSMLGFLLFFGICVVSYSQEKAQVVKDDTVSAAPTTTHKVEMGETVMMIAKKYHITPKDIYTLNPDATEGITYNSVLLLPADKVRQKPAVKKQAVASAYAASAD